MGDPTPMYILAALSGLFKNKVHEVRVGVGGEMRGVGERKWSKFDRNTLHTCMKFPNDKLIRK